MIDRSEYNKQYRLKNKEKLAEKSKIYCKNNSEKRKQQCKEWREKNKEFLKEYYQNYYKEHYSKKTREENPEKQLKTKKSYYVRKKPKLEVPLTDEEKRQLKNQKAREYYLKKIGGVKKQKPLLTEEEKKERRLQANRNYYEKKKQSKLEQKEAISDRLNINDTELYYEIVISLGTGRLSRKAVNMLIKLVNKLAKKFNYKDYKDEQDCKQEAICHLLYNWQTFNPERYSKCFPYFTELAKRAFAKQFNQLNQKQNDFNLKFVYLGLDKYYI